MSLSKGPADILTRPKILAFNQEGIDLGLATTFLMAAAPAMDTSIEATSDSEFALKCIRESVEKRIAIVIIIGTSEQLLSEEIRGLVDAAHEKITTVLLVTDKGRADQLSTLQMKFAPSHPMIIPLCVMESEYFPWGLLLVIKDAISRSSSFTSIE